MAHLTSHSENSLACVMWLVLNGFSTGSKVAPKWEHLRPGCKRWQQGGDPVTRAAGSGQGGFPEKQPQTTNNNNWKTIDHILRWHSHMHVKKFSLTPTDTLKCIFETENNWFRLQYQILKYVWQGKGNIVWSLQSELLPLLSLWLFIVESNLHRRPVNLFWNCTHTQIAVFENFGCFKLHNLHTHWSQGSFHPSLHAFIICGCTVV